MKSKHRGDDGATVGRYQKKRKLGLVPLEFSEPCRRFISAAKAGGKGSIEAARYDHNAYLRRVFGEGVFGHR